MNYPNMHEISKLILTLPIGSVPCERSWEVGDVVALSTHLCISLKAVVRPRFYLCVKDWADPQDHKVSKLIQAQDDF